MEKALTTFYGIYRPKLSLDFSFLWRFYLFLFFLLPLQNIILLSFNVPS